MKTDLKTQIKTVKNQKLGFIAILCHQTPILVPVLVVTSSTVDGKWSTLLHYAQFICIKPVKPMKIHLKPIKIGQKL